MAKPKVNQEDCIGCGSCEVFCPEVFQMENVGGRQVAKVQQTDYSANREKIDQAINSCPVQVISWEE